MKKYGIPLTEQKLVKNKEKGKEIIIGLKKDKEFGTIVTFSLGGIFSRALKDVSYRTCPVNDRDIRNMMYEIDTYPMLQESIKEDEIIGIIKKVCRMGMGENIKEFKSSIICDDKNCQVVDVKINKKI